MLPTTSIWTLSTIYSISIKIQKTVHYIVKTVHNIEKIVHDIEKTVHEKKAPCGAKKSTRWG